MLGRKTFLGIAGVALIGLFFVNDTLSQQRQRARRSDIQGQRRAQRNPRAGSMMGAQHDPEQMQKMMEQHLREQVGATEQEWQILGPRVMKVSKLSQQTRGASMMGGAMMGGGMMGRGMMGGGMMGGNMMGGHMMGSGQGAPTKEQAAMESARAQLRTVLDDTLATPDEIKTQLTALHEAKEAVKQQLAEAQEDLRKTVTVRQEAELILLDMLD
ncbi:MAG: hypothetical protein K9N55_07225 [Phycisphaerae bacterium]|nr:hypothetical protein [Phycisphaerae bacterium]